MARWELVQGSRGAADHQDLVEDFQDAVDDWFDESEFGCPGHAELADLQVEVAELAAAAGADAATDEDYAEVAEAGNVWLDSIVVEPGLRFE